MTCTNCRPRRCCSSPSSSVSHLSAVSASLATAVITSLLLNYFFTDPMYTFTIAQPQNVFLLAIFVLVGTAVAVVVDKSARRSEQARTSKSRGGHPRPTGSKRAARRRRPTSAAGTRPRHLRDGVCLTAGTR